MRPFWALRYFVRRGTSDLCRTWTREDEAEDGDETARREKDETSADARFNSEELIAVSGCVERCTRSRRRVAT